MTRARVSIAANIHRIVNVDKKTWRFLGFLNKGAWQKKSRKLFTALAGGMLAWKAGEEYLIDRYGADFSGAERESGFDGAKTAMGVDLRFFVERRDLEKVLGEFVYPSSLLFEDPMHCLSRELDGELTTTEVPGLQDSPVLQTKDLLDIEYRPLGSYRQPQPADGVGSSANAGKEPTFRVFHLADMLVSDHVWTLLEASHMVRFFTEEEAALTRGGRCKVAMPDGATMGDNIFIVEPPELPVL